ncbi:ABC transporter substrate-binding protein [Pseudonocardia nematodicida]|uniref:ABC transporter substrate-binding protein n=1 Tax=Pseudonocardia nematodicida TaxID=1206997 RepID=A0ABV1K6H5_9PSEU
MPKRLRGGRTVSAALCAGLLVLTGCTTGGETAGGTDTIRGAWITDPTTFDPALATATDDFRAVRLTYDTVVRRDSGGELVGGLASSWEQAADRVTLGVADGRTCADGTAITPEVVADSLARLADPETGSVHRIGIFGRGDATVTADEAAGSVTVALSEPHSDLLAGLATPQAGIVCPAGTADPAGLGAGSVEGAFSGPYVLTSSSPGVRHEFALRDDYDGWVDYSEPLAGRPAERLSFVVGAGDAVANQLLTGELDVAPVGGDEIARFDGDDSFTLTTATTGEYYVMFNGRNGSPFADVDARRALAQMIDREALRQIVGPEGTAIATLGDENMQCASTDTSLLQTPDPDAATPVLDGVRVNVLGANAIGTNGAAVVYLQERLLAAGAQVELRNVDVGTWISEIYDQPESWDVTLFATVNNMGTIAWGLGTVIGQPYSEGGRNTSLLRNPEATEALEAALAADTDEERCAEWDRAQRIALEAVDFVPISTSTHSYVSREGFSLATPGGREDLTTLRIAD